MRSRWEQMAVDGEWMGVDGEWIRSGWKWMASLPRYNSLSSYFEEQMRSG
jgi:hypothetical protein